MSGSIDPWEASCDREIERLMKMTDEEVLAEARAEGIDIEAFCERMRAWVQKWLSENGLDSQP